VFSVDRKVFSLTGKCFLLTNFSNGKQTQESLESDFPESEFQEINMALIKLVVSPSSKKKMEYFSVRRMVSSIKAR
jgi:hypothetical protein